MDLNRRVYIFCDQEVDRDVRAVAAPVLNGVGELLAGLSIAGPVYRINKKQISSCAKLVIQYAQKISNKLGSISRNEIRKSKY